MTNKKIVKLLFYSVKKYRKKFNVKNLVMMKTDDDGNLIFEDGQNELYVPYEVMIFSHDFCKEFFGKKIDGKIPIWKLHIKRLALIEPENRLQYFIPFLKAKKINL